LDGTAHALLLEYICEMTQRNNLEDLREHDIGVAVFGLTPGYDVVENPMVGRTCDELREKLKHFFQTQGRNEMLRIAIPKGEFRAFFYEADPSQVQEVPTALEMFWEPYWQGDGRNLLVHGCVDAQSMLIPEAYAAVQVALLFQQRSSSIELMPANSLPEDSLPAADYVLIGTPDSNPLVKRWLDKPIETAVLKRISAEKGRGAITIIAAPEPAAIMTASRFATTEALMERLLERTGIDAFPPDFLLTLA
jgi:hypothetical protein